jgi:hypothetical protein
MTTAKLSLRPVTDVAAVGRRQKGKIVLTAGTESTEVNCFLVYLTKLT